MVQITDPCAAAGGAGSVVSFAGATLSQPIGIARDGAGRIFVADDSQNQIYVKDGTSVATIGQASQDLPLSQPPSLVFPSPGTLVGTAGTALPVTVANLGNKTLAFSTSTSPLTSNFTVANLPANGAALNQGTSASSLSVSFTPQAIGNPLTDSFVLNDNNLNAPQNMAAGSAQTIKLSGIGLGVPTSIALTPGLSGATITANAAVTAGTGVPVTSGTVTFQYTLSAGGATDPSCTTAVNSDGRASWTLAAPAAAGTYNFTSSLAPGNYPITAGYGGDSCPRGWSRAA